jgi:hypothetical protein
MTSHVQTIYCAVCVYTNMAPQEAMTILGGTALCADHLGYGTDKAVDFAREQLGES